MLKPKALILTGYGINCEEETAFAFQLAGAYTKIIHINDLIDAPELLADFQILAIPGGFSYGDDTGAGNAYANKLKNHLTETLRAFVARETLVLGICNGCQIITNAGLIPGLKDSIGSTEASFRYNTTARYQCRWVDIKNVSSKCPFARGIEKMHVPVAHGEGNFYAGDEVISQLQENQQIVFQFIDPAGELANGKFPYNPNGAMLDIAAISSPDGRVMGIMPHPERHLFFTSSDRWPLEKESLKRAGKELPEEGEGLKIFQNAVSWFT